MTKVFPKKLILILLLAFLLRGGLVVINHADLSSAISDDTASYFSFSNAILNGEFWQYPTAHRTPGYPLFLALFQNDILKIIVAQIIVSLFSIVITFHLSRLLFNSTTIAFIASLFLAVSQESITHSYYLLTETLFTFLFVVSIFFLVLNKRNENVIYVVGSAMCMSLSVLTRPIAIFFPIIVVGVYLFEKETWRRKVWNTLVYIGVTTIFLGGWSMRNAIVVHIPAVTSISARSLLYYNAASLRAKQTGKLESDIRIELSDEVNTILRDRNLPLTEANETIVANELGKSIILSSPIEYAFLHIKNDFHTLLPDTDILEVTGLSIGQKGTLDYIKQNGLIRGIQYYFEGNYLPVLVLIPFMFILGVEYLGAVVAFVALLKKREYYILSILCLPIFYGFALAGSAANPRFRVPFMPFIVILSAVGIMIITEQYKYRKLNNHSDQ